MRQAMAILVRFRAALIGVVMALLALPALAQSSFTYQGRLERNGLAYSGPAWLRFSLWNAPEGGLALAPPVVLSNVDVEGGLFTVELDFGGDALKVDSYLQIEARTTEVGVYEPVTPRQAMMGAPIAAYARSAAGWSMQETPVRVFALAQPSSASTSAVLAPGATLTQTLITPAAGMLRSIWLTVGGIDGATEFDVIMERPSGPIATGRATAPHEEFPRSIQITFDVPAAITKEEQLRFVIVPVSGSMLVRLLNFSTDLYPGGTSSYVSPVPSYPFTDVIFSLGISEFASTSSLPTSVEGGSLLLRSPSGMSILQISDGPVAGPAYMEFLRGATRSVLIGKDQSGNFFLDAQNARAVTISPQNDMAVSADVTMMGTITALQTTSLQGVTAAGPATFSGGATLSGGTTINGTATLNGSTSLMGATSVGSIASPSSLGVFGSAEVNTGSLTTAPPVAFRITHANPNLTGWPIRIDNPAISGFAGGMRLSGLGFLEVTNRAGSGLSNGFARLDSAGMWSAVSDARLKTAIEGASSEGLLAAAMKVRPVTYFFRDEEARAGDVPHVGVLAQELREVLPDLVRDDGTYLTVNYAQMSVVAIGAIQAQQAQMKAQQERLEAQEATIASQQREIEALRQRLEAIERAIGAGGKD